MGEHTFEEGAVPPVGRDCATTQRKNVALLRGTSRSGRGRKRPSSAPLWVYREDGRRECVARPKRKKGFHDVQKKRGTAIPNPPLKKRRTFQEAKSADGGGEHRVTGTVDEEKTRGQNDLLTNLHEHGRRKHSHRKKGGVGKFVMVQKRGIDDSGLPTGG